MSDNFSNSDDQKSKPNGLNSKEPLTLGTYDPNADLVIDKPRLRTIMGEYRDNRGTLADYLELSTGTLSYKMNETRNACFNLREIRKIIQRYNLTEQQVLDIFFKNSFKK